MGRANTFSTEVRERAVRLVFEHQHEHESQWAATTSIAAKMGCTRETRRRWVRAQRRPYFLSLPCKVVGLRLKSAAAPSCP